MFQPTYDCSRYIAFFKRKHMPLDPKIKQSNLKNKKNAKLPPATAVSG